MNRQLAILSTTAVRSCSRHPAALLVVLSMVLLVETRVFVAQHSLTYDETFYLNLTHASLREGRVAPEFTSLGVAPLPVLLVYAAPLAGTSHLPRPSLDASRPEDVQQLRGPRLLTTLIVGVPLLATIVFWLHRRHGAAAALLGGALAALSPTVVTHTALATTDGAMALSSLVAVATLAWWGRRPSGWRLVGASSAIAVAMSVKYSGAFLLPVAFMVFLWRSLADVTCDRTAAAIPRAAVYALTRAVVTGAIVFPLWWALHGFAWAPGSAAVHPLTWDRIVDGSAARSTAPIAGFEHQRVRSRDGEEAFLLGERSSRGWWYYFPVTYLFKSTPSELGLSLWLFVTAARAALRPGRPFCGRDASVVALLASAAVLGFLLLTSHLDLGHRYMLALYPMLFVADPAAVAASLRGRRRTLVVVVIVLLGGQAWSSISAAPHYLSYVNAPSGGPSTSWRLLADSSIDWGQDLPALRAFLASRASGPTALKYFGTALPEAYGIQADDTEHLRRPPEDYRTVAISATFLDGLHLGGRDPFEDFRLLTPLANVGGSILVYDLTQEDARAAFAHSLTILH